MDGGAGLEAAGRRQVAAHAVCAQQQARLAATAPRARGEGPHAECHRGPGQSRREAARSSGEGRLASAEPCGSSATSPASFRAAPPWVACHSGWLSGPSRFEALPRPLPPVVTRAPWMSHLRGSEPGRAARPAGGRDRLPRGARACAQQVRSGFVCCLGPVTRHLPV